MGNMPYHLEKGHYLLLLEETLNEGIEAVVDDDDGDHLPGLGPPVFDARAHARRRCSTVRLDTTARARPAACWTWPEFMDDDAMSASRSPGSSPRTGSATASAPTARLDTKPHPNKPTGMWDGYQGNVERIIANVLVRALEVSLGLDHDAPHPDRRTTAKLADLLLLQMSAAVLRGLGHVAMPQRQSTRGRAGHGDLCDTRPQPPGVRPPDPDRHRRRPQWTTSSRRLRNDGEFLEEPVTAPAARSRRQAAPGVWVVTHRDHKKLNVFDTSVPSSYLEWGPPLLPIIAPENFCDVVTVQPAALQRWNRRLQAGVRGAMSTQESTFDLGVAQAAVQLDIAGVLGEFLDGKFSPDESIGEAQWRSDKSEFFAVRWRFQGTHTGPIHGFGHTFIEATGNEVSVSGLTLVENTVPGQQVDDLDEAARVKARSRSSDSSIGWPCSRNSVCCTSDGRCRSATSVSFRPTWHASPTGYNDEARASNRASCDGCADARLEHWVDDHDPTDRGPRRPAGHRGDAGVRHRRDVHLERWPHLAALRSGARPGHASRRHPPRADGHLRRGGWAKLTRRPGLAALTAGPGITNGVSAITTAHFNGSPLVVLGGRAPELRWGSGSLQEMDHVPVVVVDHQVGGHGEGRGASRGDGARRGPPGDDAAPRADVPRLPARRVRAVGRRASGGRRGVGCGTAPDPDAVAAARGADRRCRAARVHRRQRRLLGRRVGRAARGGRAPARAVLLQRSRARHAARRPRAGVPAHAWVAEAARRPRGGARHAARLPPGVRPVRQCRASRTSSMPPRRPRTHVDVTTVVGDFAQVLAVARRPRRAPSRPRRVDRRAARRRDGRPRRRIRSLLDG